MVIVGAALRPHAASGAGTSSVAALVGGAAFAPSAAVQTLAGSLVTLSVAMLGLASMFGPFWALATSSDRAASARPRPSR